MRPGCRRVMQEDHRLPLPQQRLCIRHEIGGRRIPCERGAAVLVRHGLARLVHARLAAVGLAAVDVVEHEHVVVFCQRGIEEDFRGRLLDVGPARACAHRRLIEQLIERLAVVRVPLRDQQHFESPPPPNPPRRLSRSLAAAAPGAAGAGPPWRPAGACPATSGSAHTVIAAATYAALANRFHQCLHGPPEGGHYEADTSPESAGP